VTNLNSLMSLIGVLVVAQCSLPTNRIWMPTNQRYRDHDPQTQSVQPNTVCMYTQGQNISKDAQLLLLHLKCRLSLECLQMLFLLKNFRGESVFYVLFLIARLGA
jgi:hypothetical protein